MTILLKTIWTHYSCIGISVLLLAFGCGSEDEYRMTVDIAYVNNTDSIIRFELLKKINSNEVSIIELSPSSSSEVFSYDYDGVEKSIAPETCCNDFLGNVYSNRELNGFAKRINYGSSCLIHLNEKSVLISNYVFERISERHYKFSYFFTQNDFDNVQPCN